MNPERPISELDPIVGLAVLTSAFLVNYLGSKGIIYTAERQAIRAANTDVVTAALNAIAVYAFVNLNVAYLGPELLGIWVGSFMGTRKRVRP